jgi:hypothetical protein
MQLINLQDHFYPGLRFGQSQRGFLGGPLSRPCFPASKKPVARRCGATGTFLSRGRSVADRGSHTPKAAGSSPAPATNNWLAGVLFFAAAVLLGGRLLWAALDVIGGVQ